MNVNALSSLLGCMGVHEINALFSALERAGFTQKMLLDLSGEKGDVGLRAMLATRITKVFTGKFTQFAVKSCGLSIEEWRAINIHSDVNADSRWWDCMVSSEYNQLDRLPIDLDHRLVFVRGDQIPTGYERTFGGISEFGLTEFGSQNQFVAEHVFLSRNFFRGTEIPLELKTVMFFHRPITIEGIEVVLHLKKVTDGWQFVFGNTYPALPLLSDAKVGYVFFQGKHL